MIIPTRKRRLSNGYLIRTVFIRPRITSHLFRHPNHGDGSRVKTVRTIIDRVETMIGPGASQGRTTHVMEQGMLPQGGLAPGSFDSNCFRVVPGHLGYCMCASHRQPSSYSSLTDSTIPRILSQLAHLSHFSWIRIHCIASGTNE